MFSRELPPFLREYPAMLDEDDKQLYFETARDDYTFSGSIVDLGVFLGGTTACLLLGALANMRLPHRLPDPLVHVYDRFIADHGALPGLNWQQPAHKFHKEGDCFFDRFRAQLSGLFVFTNTHRGDIAEAVYSDDRHIEVLGVDICKARHLTDAVVRQFFIRLAPGSHVLHQDYIHEWLPHIMTAMGYFDDRFELIDECRTGCTVRYRMLKPITQADLAEFSETCLRSKKDWLPLFDLSVSRLKLPASRERMAPARTLLLAETQGISAAKEYAESARATFTISKHLDRVLEVMPTLSS
jgi:hypothetical protein